MNLSKNRKIISQLLGNPSHNLMDFTQIENHNGKRPLKNVHCCLPSPPRLISKKYLTGVQAWKIRSNPDYSSVRGVRDKLFQHEDVVL